MKTFYLLRLQYGANVVMNEIKRATEKEAIVFFQRLYPELNLNDSGYATARLTEYANVSYTIACKFGE